MEETLPFLLAVGAWQDEQNEPNPLAWFVASVMDIIWLLQPDDSELLQLSSCYFFFHGYMF